MPEAVYIGIDVSKARLDVAVRPTGEIFSHPNTLEGIAQLVQQLQAQTPCLIVLEPTGGYEQNALIELAQVGLPVVLVNARQVRDCLGPKQHLPGWAALLKRLGN
jgi:transposase